MRQQKMLKDEDFEAGGHGLIQGSFQHTFRETEDNQDIEQGPELCECRSTMLPVYQPGP
jgi:hypothetical protein